MPRLILISGLGCNRLLFEPQRHHFDQDLFLPDWIPPMYTRVAGKKPIPELLSDYARRWAERWKETVLSNLEVRRAYWLGGVSMGGMIALEAAEYLAEEGLPPKGVFLIASAREGGTLTFLMRLRLRLLTHLGPGALAFVLRKGYALCAKREGLSDLDQLLFKRMAEGVSLEMVRWGAAAVASWTQTEAQWKALVAAGVPIHQIHGERDWAVPLDRRHVEQAIPGGRHLINITHADAVNEYIESRMKR